MIIEAKIRADSEKDLLYAKLDYDTASYYAWLAMKKCGLFLGLPRLGAHITIINGKFDKINKEAFNKANQGDLGSIFLNLDMSKLRIQKGGGGKFTGVYLFFESGVIFEDLRRKFGVNCDKNFKPHLSLCNNKSIGKNIYCRNGKKYFNYIIDKQEKTT